MNATLAIFDKAAAWTDYDTTARSLPDCEHNRAWWKEGSARPQPPDCEHNRPWRASLRAAWETYLAASENDRAGIVRAYECGTTKPAAPCEAAGELSQVGGGGSGI